MPRQLHFACGCVTDGVNCQRRLAVYRSRLIVRRQQIDTLFCHQKRRWRIDRLAGACCGIWSRLCADGRLGDDCRLCNRNRGHGGCQRNFSGGRNFRQVGQNTGHRQHARNRAWIQHKKHHKVTLRIRRCCGQLCAIKPQGHLRPRCCLPCNKGLAIGFDPQQIESRNDGVGG